jgi:hypothetical protein
LRAAVGVLVAAISGYGSDSRHTPGKRAAGRPIMASNGSREGRYDLPIRKGRRIKRGKITISGTFLG